ncbi:MAG: lipoate--protein ligase family protein [Anaerolineae bacterium]|nr:lipoate--protein ligase family protein [Anaerolineae bacterium]
MKCYFLDKVTWQHSQALYHAAAHLGREALFILRPATPYVCLGFHQDAEVEIDLAFTRENDIPVFRREVGGGAVYLDGEQLFYQLIVRADRPGVPEDKAEFYRKFLAPVVETYREFGVEAEYKPVNDIIANGRKVSGNGAAEIEGMMVLVGNFIMDFNYEMMSKSLRVPDEKFRDKIFKTLQENMSTMLRETGKIPPTAALAESLRQRYFPLLGDLPLATEVEADIVAEADRLFAEMYADAWLFANDRRRPEARQVKIRDGVYVIQNMLKTPGGLVRVTAVQDEGVLRDVHLSGDFFFYPAQDLPLLERKLEGVLAESQAITQAAADFYAEQQVESPGVQPEDFARVLTPAA